LVRFNDKSRTTILFAKWKASIYKLVFSSINEGSVVVDKAMLVTKIKELCDYSNTKAVGSGRNIEQVSFGRSLGEGFYFLII
jgi:hypothetical protein